MSDQPEIAGAAPDREAAERGAVTELVMSAFRLNGIFLAIGESLSRVAGLTPARWQVLGAVLRGPLSVAGIARDMGLTRQSVQRNANLLVESGFAEYLENPAHRRAKLLAVTEAGRAAIRTIAVEQHVWAQALSDRIGEPRLRQALGVLDDVIAVLASDVRAARALNSAEREETNSTASSRQRRRDQISADSLREDDRDVGAAEHE